ncbi:inactive leucine-rich repeat receptor-like serine/threonine-protein kinase At1g60630 [Aristolochia californica]|uniref:inactive leucine-rich repeat receptor-like serine/threonine-protein kinase At1g60630 n=1 Tax=Aristolochia californica TaxID=171875 RepID=UPI0035DEE5BF
MEYSRCFLLYILFLLPFHFGYAKARDAEALLGLKSSIDPSNALPWPEGSDVCQWMGIKECLRGRVSKLVLEFKNLTGSLEEKSLNMLDQLRVLSFKGNSISGPIPNFSGLINLKSLFLNDNQFTGEFPTSLSTLHRLKVIVVSGNKISGHIPDSLNKLPRLYTLLLQDNLLTGEIPPFSQASLTYFNVSNNLLSGKIPVTPVLSLFNSSSFSNNLNLCGEQTRRPCIDSNNALPRSPTPESSFRFKDERHKYKKRKMIIILASSIGGFLLALLCFALVWRSCRNRENTREPSRDKGLGKVEAGGAGGEGPSGGNNAAAKGGFAWDAEGLGSLVFCGGVEQMYKLEDLLKASAETLGRGTVGSTYKAVMESGFIVTVKRLKDSNYPSLPEFRRHMDVLGRLRHPNLVPLRAYFQAKEERLLVYDYFPNGSLFSLIHGSKPAGGGKPLHWTSCLKIAEDLAAGLVYLHETTGLIHGNLKSSNVLLGSDFESCLTDYGLYVFRSPDSYEEGGVGASSLFYCAPECRPPRKSLTRQSDVYSYGVLVLELLTGKTPFQDLVQEHGADIPTWVRSVREEETESGDDPASGNEANEDKLISLLNIAVSCVTMVADNRPAMKEVLRMIREARADAQVSSNSSDHSPGRWSDTVQSLPRVHDSDHHSFSERD